MSNNHHPTYFLTTELRTRRASMALNNMGVSLLERGDFIEALKMFRDSLALLKLSAECSSGTVPATLITHHQQQHDSSSAAAAQADEALRLASTALLNSHPESSIKSSPCAASCSAVVCPVDDSDVPSMRAALNTAGLSRSSSSNSSTATVFFPIRLRCTDFETNLDFQAGKVMYNFGLAHLLLYSSSSSSSSSSSPAERPRFQASRLLEGSLKNLSLSHCLLTRNIDSNNYSHRDTTTATTTTIDQFQILCQMLVATLVLHNLYQVFQYQNELPKAQQVLSSLSVLSASVDDSMIRFTTVHKCTVSPAA